MANSFTVGRAQLLFALCLPLAILLGYLLSDPMDPSNKLVGLLMLGVLSIPLLIRGYHATLVFAWNAAITPVFLPGQAFLWVPLAFLGIAFAIVNRFTNPEVRFISAPSITKPLLFLFASVLVIAVSHGGFGLRSFGSESYGGRNYVYIFAAIVGYFVFASQRIPLPKANSYVALFFLMGITALVPNLAFAGGRAWYFLFYFFPPVYALEQAVGSFSLEPEITRVLGLTAASIALLCWLLAHYGLRNLFRKPLAIFLFTVSLIGCLFCGFRVVLVIFALTLGLQFLFEGFYKNKGLVIGLLSGFVIGGIILVVNVEKLPLVAQRTLSVLPIRLNPIVERSSEGSTLWRVTMWKELLPEIPKYLLTGKGFAIDPTDLAFAEHNARYGNGAAGAIAAGDYHNGPLSLVIPLGIWGVIGFTWLAFAGLQHLYRHYKYGDPELRRINTFLLSYFLARLILFVFVFGGFFSDLFIFTGILGLSVSLNGTSQRQTADPQLALQHTPHELEYGGQFADPRLS